MGCKESNQAENYSMKTGQWYGVGHYAVIIKQKNTERKLSIIIKVKTSIFEWCIVCPSKVLLDKATR